MRALTSAVIGFEILILILFIPAALQNELVNSNFIVYSSIFLILFSIIILGLLKKRIGLILGSVFQLILIGLGFFVNWMYILGLIFLGLWIASIKIGKKTDQIKSSFKPKTDAK
jgi:choline-glycine betaine transporter